MGRPQDIIAEKRVSALLDNVEMARLSKLVLGFDGQISAKLSKKMIGGYWVSGKAYLTRSAFEFHPGFLNRPFYKNMDELHTRIAWSEMTQVRKRFGMVAQIIDLNTPDSKCSIRCLGATEFARKIEQLRTAHPG